MKKTAYVTLVVISGLCLPETAAAQGLAGKIESLHSVLDKLFDEMLPLCEKMTGIGRAIAGFAALWYIGSRVWKHIAAAESIDFYPLLRPFAIALCIAFFPAVISVMNGVLKPTVTGTREMVKDSDKAIERLLKEKEEAMKKTIYWKMYVGPDGSGDRELWMQYAHIGEKDKFLSKLGHSMEFALSKAYYNMKNTVKEWMSIVLQVFYQAAALCINTMRTFNLIVLVILGPLAFGIAVFDGFQHTLTIWLARYINVFLWLPIANVFGAIIAKIQENMLILDKHQITQTGDTFFSESDISYLIFMVIAIVGYSTIPNVANHIINAGSDSMLTHKITNRATSMAMGAASGGASVAMNGMAADGIGDTMSNVGGNMGSFAQNSPYFPDGQSKGNPFLADKLKGS